MGGGIYLGRGTYVYGGVANYLPDSAKLILKLLGNGWIERSGTGNEVAYRITPNGLAAKIAPIKV